MGESFRKWEMLYSPCDKDPDRWRLKLKIEEPDMISVLGKINCTKGRPFFLDESSYDFGVFLYNLGERDFYGICSILKKENPNGQITGPTEKVSFRAVLENIAKDLDILVFPGSDVSVQEETKEEPKRAEPEKKQAEPAKIEVKETYTPPAPANTDEKFDDLDINPKYTFEEFVIGPNNRFTAAAAQAVADNPSKIYNPFFIYGGVGLGKTHLMHAVGHYVRKKNPSAKLLYVTTEKFMSDVIDSIRHGSLKTMRDHYRQVDLLMVDDIQFLEESESTQEEFFHTFNVLHQNGKQIIITSDRPPKRLTTLEDRLRSRFEWGLIADIKSPNLETRIAILKRKEQVEHIRLDDNILLYIASKLKSNIRELEGFLKRINAYAALTHQEVNMDLVRTIMADLLPQEELDEENKATPPAAEKEPEVFVIKPSEAVKPEQKPVEERHKPETVKQEPEAHEQKPEMSSEPVQKTKMPDIKEEELVIVTKTAPAAPKPQPRPAEGQDSGLKQIDVAFFYPEGKNEELLKVKERFKEVIKKHKLKFRLESIFDKSYSFAAKIDYNMFFKDCNDNNASIAVVLGPPLEASVSSEDFSNILATVMDEQRISLQLVPWAELNKDYRYLNLSLDITLLKHRG